MDHYYPIHGSDYPIHGPYYPIHGPYDPIHGPYYPIHGPYYPIHGPYYPIHGPYYPIHGKVGLPLPGNTSSRLPSSLSGACTLFVNLAAYQASVLYLST